MKPGAKKTANARDLKAVLDHIRTMTRDELLAHVNWRPADAVEVVNTPIGHTRKTLQASRKPNAGTLRFRKLKRQA